MWSPLVELRLVWRRELKIELKAAVSRTRLVRPASGETVATSFIKAQRYEKDEMEQKRE